MKPKILFVIAILVLAAIAPIALKVARPNLVHSAPNYCIQNLRQMEEGRHTLPPRGDADLRWWTFGLTNTTSSKAHSGHPMALPRDLYPVR